MILKPNDILREGDIVKTRAGDTFGTLSNHAYIGQPAAALIDALGNPDWYVAREYNVDYDRIIARLEKIRVSIWEED